MAGGRPSKYRPEFAAQAFEHCKLGAVQEDLAALFKVGTTTIERWMAAHEEFRGAVKDGAAEADRHVVESLYGRAMGGDVTAMIFWLKNRRPQHWRDVKDNRHSGEINHKHEQVDAAANAFADRVLSDFSRTEAPGNAGKPH